MRLTRTEIAETGVNLKSWLAQAQHQAKQVDAPQFQISGPMQLRTRVRRIQSRGAASQTTMWTYRGDEKFRVSSIYIEPIQTTDTVEVGITMVPADMDLVKEISSLSMPLADAFETFDGLESWVMNMTGSLEERKEALAGPSLVPKPPKHEDDPRWGAW